MNIYPLHLLGFMIACVKKNANICTKKMQVFSLHIGPCDNFDHEDGFAVVTVVYPHGEGSSEIRQ